MIAFGAFAGLAGLDVPIINFIGDATVALFTGLLIAYGMARHYVKAEETADAFTAGLRTSGGILLVTGVGGSLGAVIKATGLADLLGDLFSAEQGMSVVLIILLAWFVAALMHLAIGSVSVAAITAAGILAPIVGSLPVAPVIVGLAIASGSLFALQVNSNFFWLYKSLLGLSTQGTLKTMTTVTAMGSLVSLPIVMAASLIPIG
ncbi:D-serine transporter DsdX [bioreactor metagenome]|uniref:D-serine transporter DsdX n=1 Tax=bioreactor metagenome TaxID=1076179 RepID=A0A645ANM4_9ZZZZ